MTIKKTWLLKSANKPSLTITGFILLALALSFCNNPNPDNSAGTDTLPGTGRAPDTTKIPHTLNNWLSWDITFKKTTNSTSRSQALLDSRYAIKQYLDSINNVQNTNFMSTINQDSTSPYHYMLNTNLGWSLALSDSTTKPPPCPKPPPSVTILVVDEKVIQVCTPE